MAAAGVMELVELGDRYEIAPSQRLPIYDSGLAEAYAATDRSDSSRKIFALISPGHLANRGLSIAAAHESAGPYLMWPIGSGIVDWPIRNTSGDIVWGRRPAFIYLMPKGERILNGKNQLPTLGESQLIKHFIQPAINMLRNLMTKDHAHRAIRPQNLYYQDDRHGDIIFGECLASLPGSHQSAALEPIDSAISDPVGRGNGTFAEDIYSIGATALMLYLGKDPVAHLNEEQIINAKINIGSFSTLAGGDKIPPSLSEFLRGTLCDKVSDRWTIKQLEGWVTGAHFNPILVNVAQRASRPLIFCDHEYLSKPALAHAMSRHWNEAIALVAHADFDNWFKRGFGDDKAQGKLQGIHGYAAAYGQPSGIRDRAVSRFIIHMGGNLPLCYKEIRSTVVGIGAMLSHYYDHKDKVEQITEILRARLPHAWLEEQPNLYPAQMQVRRSLETIDKFIDRPGPGFGIERVLYELNRGTPCKSALIADYYVVDMTDLLPAIDAAIPGAAHGTLPIDRHIAAFIATNMKRQMDSEIAALANRSDEVTYRIGILRLLALVQRVHQQFDLPRLCQVVVEMLDPVIASFHNAGMRDHIRKEIDKHAKTCRFDEMLLLLDGDGQLKKADDTGFTQATKQYASLERARSWLAEGGLTDTARVRGIAHKVAATSATLACAGSLAAYGLFALVF